MKTKEQAQAPTDQTEAGSSGDVVTRSSSIAPAPASPPFDARASNGPERSVELHIEELALHGFAPGDRYRVADALERELTRLFTEQGPPSAITHDREIEHFDAGTFATERDADIRAVAAQLAKAIRRGLDK